MSCNDPCLPVIIEPCKVLVDYMMQVGNTNVYFVAKLPAILRAWGPEFSPQDIHQAELRAAATLAQTDLIRGQAFQFMRLGLPWTQAEVAAFLGVTVPEVMAWEAETIPVPRASWIALADYVAQVDGRDPYDIPPACPRDSWQSRVIRVYPDFPMKSTQTNTPGQCTPC